jgi:hypothetical protein
MRRYWREQRPKSIFRSAELLRLLGGLMMLAVLAMLIVRAGEPNTWRWLVSDDAPPPQQPSAPAPPPPPPPSGPTDEDPEQIEAAHEEFQALTDGTLALGREEMEAYDRLVEWVKNQSFARLWSRAKKDVWYTDLYDQPERHRGELLGLELDIRRARDEGESRYGARLHEAWGATAESRGRLYVLLVVDYPKGMPVGHDIHARARFAGYFLKLQGYESGMTRPGDRPEKAPLLIGRLEWLPARAPRTDTAAEWIVGLAVLALVGLGFLVNYFYRRRHPHPRPYAPAKVVSTAEQTMSIDQWLEQAELTTGETSTSDDAVDSPDADKELDAS